MTEEAPSPSFDRVLEFELVADAARLLAEATSAEAMYEIVWKAVIEVMECEDFAVSSYSSQDALIRAVHIRRYASLLDPTPFPPLPLDAPGFGTQSLVIRSGEPVLFDDFRKAWRTCATRYVQDELDGLRQSPPPPTPEDDLVPPSAMMVPLRADGKVSGVLQVFSTNYHAYAERHLELLELLGGALGSGLHNLTLRTHSSGAQA